MNLMHTIKNLQSVNEDIAIQKEIDEAQKFHQNLIKKAIQIAKKSSGNFDKAYAAIDKIKKGLADFPMVATALKTANEGVEQNVDLDSLFEEALDEGKQYKIDKVFAKKGDYVFGKDSKADISVVTYKGKQVSTGYYDSGSDDFWMNHKTFRGEMAFNDAKKLVDYFAKNKIVSESVELDLDALFEEELREDYFTVQYYNGNKNAVDDKFQNFKTKAQADKYAKKGNSIDRVGGEYKVFKVKGRMESVELDEARSGYVGTISGGNSIAIKIDGIDDGEARLGTRNGMKAIDAFKKIAKKTYADAKGKKTIPAVKKAIKMQGATQYYAKWKSDSSGYKDDSVEIWYTKSVKESVELDEINNGLGSFVSQMKLLLKDPKAKKAHKVASSLIMRAQDKSLQKTAISAIKKALPGLAKKAGGKWEKKIVGMKTMMIESVELTEAKASLDKDSGYEVYASGKSSAGVMLFLSYKGKIIASGSKKDGQFVFGFKHKDINPNARYQPAGMVKKGKDFTHMGFKTAKEVIGFAKKLDITEDIRLDEISRRELDTVKGIAHKANADKPKLKALKSSPDLLNVVTVIDQAVKAKKELFDFKALLIKAGLKAEASMSPVGHVRVKTRGKDILIYSKKYLEKGERAELIGAYAIGYEG